MRVIVGVSPYSHCAEAKTLWDPRGIPSANIIVSIAGHGHIVFGDPKGSPSKITIKVYYARYMGIKVLTKQFFDRACDHFVSPLSKDRHICVCVAMPLT